MIDAPDRVDGRGGTSRCVSREGDDAANTEYDDERGPRAEPGPMHGKVYCRRPPD